MPYPAITSDIGFGEAAVKGKVAVVTGAASGIGFAIAKEMSNAGASVVLADVSAQAGETALANLRESGATAEFVPGDISKSADVRRLMEVAAKQFGRIDILVNNAGLQHIAPIVEFPEERWDHLIGVILTGTFLCCKYAVPHMIRQKWGRVINIASLHGKVASPFKAAYIAAKHGVLGLTKVLALEVAEHGITSDIELIPIQQVNQAFERILKSDVKYRFVIDMASLK